MVALALLLMAPRLALAHAVLVSSTPEAHATVRGPEVTIHLKFNSRVDGVRSRIFLKLPNGQTQTEALDPQDAPDALRSHAKLQAGSYILLWQALSTDGHTTRGEIPFTVQ
uniref:Copper resistance protein CopC n=2 Tax=Paracidobacterium acidisoli TaxID=2303751 RepID=A0A372IR34_9BACT